MGHEPGSALRVPDLELKPRQKQAQVSVLWPGFQGGLIYEVSFQWRKRPRLQRSRLLAAGSSAAAATSGHTFPLRASSAVQF